VTRQALDCRKCGVCCVCPVDHDTYCELTPEDVARLSKKFIKENVIFVPPFNSLSKVIDGHVIEGGIICTKWRTMRSGPFKEYEMNTCAALRGSIMSAVSCSIYEKRPVICRTALKPNNKDCLRIRKAFRQTIKDLDLPEGDGLYRAYLNGVR